jgi:hypothetical protein
MDLSVVYSKTPKGLRARASLIGGLPAQLMKVLAHIDGASKAQSILVKLDDITEEKLIYGLALLEREGYIKSVVVTRPSDDDWALTENFAPMVVEEVLSVEEAETKAKEDAQLAAQRKAEDAEKAEKARQQAEIKAREEEAQALEKEKVKEKLRAEARVKAQLEADRLTREKEEKRKKAEADAAAKAQAKEEAARKAEDERKAKAEEEARLEVERKAKAEEKTKAEEEARLKAEADAKAKIEQKEHVRREIERIAREAEEAEQKKAEAKARAKAEEEAKLHAERKAKEEEELARAKAAQARLEAETKAKAAEEMRQQAELKAQEAAKQAQAKAEAEAKENTRRELLRIAREVEEAQRKAEAERRAKEKEQARLETERKAKAEEKARLKAEAEEKAKVAEKEKEKAKEKDRNEIARIVREAEEARKKAEAQAKEERLEAKRKAKEEQDAKLKVTRKPKVEEKLTLAKSGPEETINVDANLQASLAMQQFANDVDEESKKSIAEAKAKEERQEAKREAKAEQEAERIRVRAEAEEKSKGEEKERARLEMERISREANEVRQKQSAEVHANIRITATETVKPKSWEEIEAEEERAFAEEEAGNTQPEVKHTEEKHITIEKETVEDDSVGRVIQKITQEEAERLGREEIKRAAKEEAEVLAKTYAKRSAALLSYKKWISKANKAIKPLLIYSPLVIVLLIGLLHFINLSMLVAPIEKIATASLGETVNIGQVHASLLPQPHFALENVTIGANPESKKEGLKIELVNAYAAPTVLFDDVKLLKSLEFEGLKITQDNFGQPQQWVNNLGKAQHVKIEQLKLKKIVLQIRDLEIGKFDGKVELSESRELKSYHLTSDTLSAQITPQGSSFEVALTGNSWSLPMNPKLIFDEFKANGTLTQSQINFSQIDGKVYGGNINAKAAVDWSSEWSAAGNFDLSNVTASRLLSAFESGVSIDGKLKLKGLFSSRSVQAAQLVDMPEMTVNFELGEGKINDIDLARAVLFKGNQPLAGGATRFDKLTGNLQLTNGHYQYEQLVLEADQFNAKGNVDIQSNQDVSGKISANLTAQSRRLSASFNLTGKVGNLKKQ